MNKFGAITAGIFCVALAISMIFLLKKDSDWADISCGFIGIAEIFSIVMLIYNIYMYIGWKYAPEIKSIEYVMQLFKN